MDAIRLEGMTGDLAGLYKLRVGDYGVIYEVFWDEVTIVSDPGDRSQPRDLSKTVRDYMGINITNAYLCSFKPFTSILPPILPLL